MPALLCRALVPNSLRILQCRTFRGVKTRPGAENAFSIANTLKTAGFRLAGRAARIRTAMPHPARCVFNLRGRHLSRKNAHQSCAATSALTSSNAASQCPALLRENHPKIHRAFSHPRRNRSIRASKGTLVSANTGVPPKISGSLVITVVYILLSFIQRSYQVSANIANG